MNLYLLRHGIAVERKSAGHDEDRDRPLTVEGEEKIRRIARAMRELELSFDLILSSPYLRARQTAEIVADAFEIRKRLEFCDHLVVGGDAKELIRHLKEVRSLPETILLVGHEPYLGRLVSWLIGGNPEASVAFKKGGLCKLAVSSWKSGRCATLEWLLTPRQMMLMA